MGIKEDIKILMGFEYWKKNWSKCDNIGIIISDTKYIAIFDEIPLQIYTNSKMYDTSNIVCKSYNEMIKIQNIIHKIDHKDYSNIIRICKIELNIDILMVYFKHIKDDLGINSYNFIKINNDLPVLVKCRYENEDIYMLLAPITLSEEEKKNPYQGAYELEFLKRKDVRKL